MCDTHVELRSTCSSMAPKGAMRIAHPLKGVCSYRKSPPLGGDLLVKTYTRTRERFNHIATGAAHL